MANCSECSGTGVAERIGGYDRTCDVCRGDGRFPSMTNPKHTSSDPDTQEAIAWANKVIKAKGTSYTPASRNAAAFILASCDRIEALEAENERLTARVAELKEALASMVEYSRYNECWQDRHPEYIERARAALKEDTRHD